MSARARPSALRRLLATARWWSAPFTPRSIRARPSQSHIQPSVPVTTSSMRMPKLVRSCSDPFAHGLLAGAVAAPLVRSAGRRPVLTAVVAGTLIDVDHVLAARSLRPVTWITLGGGRPRAHTLLLAVGAGGVAGLLGGRAHGWAAFGGLASHLLRDASDRDGAPILWPLSGRRHIPRTAYAAGIAGLALGSWLVSRSSGASGTAPAAASSGAGDGGAGARPRTG